MVFGELLGTVGSLIGGDKQRRAANRARRLNEQNVQEIRGLFGQARDTETAAFDRASPFMQLMLTTLQDGARRSESAVSRGGQQALNRIDRFFETSRRSGNARLARSGLYNSTLGLAVERGAAADAADAARATATQTGRDLGRQISSNSRAVASGQQGLADFERARGRAISDLLTREAGFLSGVQHTVEPGIAAGYGSLFGSLGGLLDLARNEL